MGVIRSGFYRYLNQIESPDNNLNNPFHTLFKEVFEKSGKSYGSRRMSKAMQSLGYSIGRFKARSLMQKLGLQVRQTRRFKVITNSNHKFAVAPNVMANAFAGRFISKV